MVGTLEDMMSYLQPHMNVSDLFVILKKIGSNVWKTTSDQIFLSGDILD